VQFTSVAYLAFLALAVGGYFALPGPRTRTAWMLAASYAFYYSLSSRWTIVLAAITMLGFLFGLALERFAPAEKDAPLSPRARGLLAVAIVVVSTTLAVFKYAAFGAGLLSSGLAASGVTWQAPILKFALPVGISFWTFQTISYLVDTARGRMPAERDPLRYALFVAFFPQVTAGPIARGGQLLPQLAEKHAFSYDRMRSALLMMLWGFVKKLLVADPLGVFVGQVFGKPHTYGNNGLFVFAACVAFSVQIYCDFSGYTDVARGSARLFGIELLPNFERPYESRSIKEFWRRWHMSLMSWLREYIYFPLGGSRVAPWRRYVNVMAVFLFSGLWHGAGLTFVAWGALNGLYQVVGDASAGARARIATALRIAPGGAVQRAWQTVATFGLITVAWVFFRAATLADALYILRSVATTGPGDFLLSKWPAIALPSPQLAVALIGAVLVFAFEHFSATRDLPVMLARAPLPLRWATYLAGIMAVVIFGYYGSVYSASDFAYFRF
jgi:D-alanyl-lipoteichoic acid acyltransferase DltB (MBOAT superfamily)